MEKIIKISNKEYKMKSSAYTQFAYKNETGRSLLKDLQELIDLKNKDTDSFEISDLDDVTELLLKISYIMIKEADDKQVGDYISFAKGIDDIYSDESWIEKSLELACLPISGRLHSNQ